MQSHNDRPYRSHLRPACVACRRRKSRCQSEAGSEACLMCRAHRTDCVFPPAPVSSTRTPEPGRRRRQTLTPASRVAGGRGSDPTPAALPTGPGPEESILGQQTPVAVSVQATLPVITPTPEAVRNPNWTTPGQSAPEDESPLVLGSQDDQPHSLHIVGPAATNDHQVLSDYLSSMPGGSHGSRIVVPTPRNRSKPVLFTVIQKRPVGLPGNRSPAAEKLEMIEKLLEPYCENVIDLYFQKVNVCLPLLDEASFRRQYREGKERISPALLACLFAHTITFWRTSSVLSHARCPDSRFIWNLANEALYSELYLSPGLSIIEAILLNVGGRPTTSLIGNGVLLGSAVGLAHSSGLNHNPLPWEIPEPEKHLRMKIWWNLLVHDKWMSLARGTPPHITKSQYDVPHPALQHLCDQYASDRDRGVASIFIALFRLTDVLDLHLNYIYHFCRDEPPSTTHLELALNNWVEMLDDTIRRIIIRGTNLDIPGAANLRLAYLTVRLLLQRIDLENDKKLYGSEDSRLINRYIQARRTSEEILHLTQELKPEHLADFWLPGSAFAFPTTVSFLLRCALETENSSSGLAQSSSLRIASNLISALRLHQEKGSWDLSDICLAQHAEIVEKVLSKVPEQAGAEGSFDLQDFIMPDASMIDQFFPSLWDPLSGAGGVFSEIGNVGSRGEFSTET